ncbi:MAG: peptide chain release factor 3, partial [Bacteroidota bacterium]
EGRKINILDTPGHQDFAEDTYRTLTAVDSVIVVIDVAKGVEIQTEKLVGVCQMRKTPVIVFINKLDRFGKDAMELLDEVEEKLGLKVCPLSWPIGMGSEFQGVYNIFEQKLSLFTENNKQTIGESIEFDNLEDEKLEEFLGEKAADLLREEAELVQEVYPDFDIAAYQRGEISPVFFGSAINNFGVKEMLDCFVQIAPPPQPSTVEEGEVKPEGDKFSGFVFKIHANMDPKHRDRIAFVKICSGQFERNHNYLHVRSGKQLKFSNPTSFMAEKKSVVDHAYPGDIVGLHDTGNFKIGDALTEGDPLKFKGIPSFAPELFRYIDNANPMKAKQFHKGIEQLMDEGVAQLFTSQHTGRKILGTVGALQFEVIQYRLEHEYGAKCHYEPISLHKACWVRSEDEKQYADFRERKSRYMATDKYGRDVFLANSSFAIDQAQQQFPEVEFYFTSEF